MALRALGILLTASAVVLVYLTGFSLGGRKAGVWAAVFLITSPLAVQSALLLDYPAILMFLLALFLLLAVRSAPSLQPTEMASLALLVAVLCWANLGPFLPLAMAFFLWRWWRSGLIASLGQTSVVFGGGALLFAVTWRAGSALWGLPFALPFQHGLRSGLAAADSAGYWLMIVQRVIGFCNPYLILLALVVFLGLKGNSVQSLVFPALLAGVLTVTYSIAAHAAYGFPKYYAQMLPALCVLCGASVAGLEWKGLVRPAVVAALAAALYLTMAVGDPILGLGKGVWWLPAWWPLQSTTAVAGVLVLCILVLLVTLGLAGMPRGWHRLVQTALLCATIAYALGTYTVQSCADYSTRYNYGETGMGSAIDFLRLRVAPGQPVICQEDIAYYVGNHNFWPPVDYNRALDPRSPASVARLIEGEGIAGVVYGRAARRSALANLPLLGDWEHAQFGEYHVLLRPTSGRE